MSKEFYARSPDIAYVLNWWVWTWTYLYLFENCKTLLANINCHNVSMYSLQLLQGVYITIKGGRLNGWLSGKTLRECIRWAKYFMWDRKPYDGIFFKWYQTLDEICNDSTFTIFSPNFTKIGFQNKILLFPWVIVVSFFDSFLKLQYFSRNMSDYW